MIVDTFAGPGGWSEGLKLLGRSDEVGLEWDAPACATAYAAGHARIRADVATYPTEPFADVEGHIASPPCQAWSMAGKRKGEADRANCHTLADRMADGDDSTSWTSWEDPRSPLVCQPVRWVRDLRPRWVALEEVPAVASLWEHFARIFRSWGYSVWTGDLCAADYGVPQTRTRRILMASRTRVVQPPPPTHAQYPQDGADLFGGQLDGWVSMATALGWGFDREPSCTVTGGGTDAGGAEPFGNAGYRERLARFVSAGVTGQGRPKDPLTQPADTPAGKGTAYWIRMGNQTGATVRHITEPAPTILTSTTSDYYRRPVDQASPTLTSNVRSWAWERPATTVVGSYCPDVISPPGYRTTVSRQNAEGGVRVTVAEAGILQSFPPDYPWQGSRTAQYSQCGNAIPPVLAAHILAALGAGTLPQERVA